MPIVTRHSLITVAVLAMVSLLIIGFFVWSGLYNIGADDTHTRPVYSVLQTLRERSIATRSKELQPPDLTDPARIKQGAGNYNAMCTGCHLGPGMAETELSKGLYPAPPNLTQHPVDPKEAFWVIKHGIKASGMPAWGKSMEDDYIWNMAAFLQQLPKLNAEQYQALVASSGGHSHGGGETGGHAHAAGETDDHHDDGDEHERMEGMPADEAKPHSHPPGTPAHQDKAADPHAGMDMGADKTVDEAKPHSHAPGTPAHDDSAPAAKKSTKPALPADEHAGMTMPAPAPAEHTDGGHQH